MPSKKRIVVTVVKSFHHYAVIPTKSCNSGTFQFLCFPVLAMSLILLAGVAYNMPGVGCVSSGMARWLEQRLIYRELMQREKQQREDECAQLDFLSVLGVAA